MSRKVDGNLRGAVAAAVWLVPGLFIFVLASCQETASTEDALPLSAGWVEDLLERPGEAGEERFAPAADPNDWLILADTNRDGKIDDKDVPDRGKEPTLKTGALLFVNCNDSDGDGKIDGLEFDKDEKPILPEDKKINGAQDEADVTEIRIRKLIGVAKAAKVTLKVSKEDLRAFHLFAKIADKEGSVWGGPGEDPGKTEFEITTLLGKDVDEDGNSRLGIEGLMFRYTHAGDMQFDGVIELTCKVQDPADVRNNRSDTIKLKVAPYLMQPNTQESIKIFAQDRPANNKKFIDDLRAAVGAQLATYDASKMMDGDCQWCQDNVEIGFTATPRAAANVALFNRHHVPPGNGDMPWVRDVILVREKLAGLYRGPVASPGDSGEYGGNLELLPPTTKYPLGRVCYGDSMSAKRQQFLKDQEAQEPFEITTNFLSVGHVDEIVSFAGGGKVVIASPKLAMTIIKSTLYPADAADADEPADEIPPWAPFYAIGQVEAGVATRRADVSDGPDYAALLIDDTRDFTAGPWQYVRIYDGVGHGQVGHIVERGVGWAKVDIVWDTLVQSEYGEYTSIALHVPGDDADEPARTVGGRIGYDYPTRYYGWFELPQTGSAYVLVEDSYFWPRYTLNPFPVTPGVAAVVTKAELARDPVTEKLNTKIQEIIDEVKKQIEKAMDPDKPEFVEVPVIFTARITEQPAADGTPKMRSCVAWSPGAANIQYAAGKIFIAKQNGPIDKGTDLFATEIDKRIKAALGSNPIFLDDFDYYHRLSGEVHCGTNVIRKYDDWKEWWKKLP